MPELQHERLSEYALRKLREHGIEVRLKTDVKEVTGQGVVLGSGELILSGLVVSTIGAKPAAVIEGLNLPLEKGRLKTLPDMRVQAGNIWATGDCAVATNAFDNQLTSSTAQFAIREAAQLAANLKRVLDNSPNSTFSLPPSGAAGVYRS